MSVPQLRLSAHRAPAEDGIFRRSAYPLTLILAAVVAIVVITGVGFALKGHPVDLPLSKALNGLHTGALGAFTSAVYHVISPVPAIIITVVICAAIWLLGKNLRAAVALGGMVAVTWLPSAVVKMLVDRTRPDAAVMAHPFIPVQTDASFPSGHTVFIVAFVIAVAYLLRGSRWQRLWTVVGTVLVAVVALSIMIDAMHYPTDVLASIVWSLSVAPAVRVIGVDWVMPRIPFLAPPTDHPALTR
ncbi:phosphatase PAP2 family protein [Raineyella sp. LH-20]|uniref:phosphatase PAP2 family protein n=1 Tax=Raineyella sp. LH-20 TaxID=3081204 RepID=UPI00295453F3|nr:phosphatase PAP2 family protein [Raineyella sp. LH-20]WOP19064.1 phosphatase PAP2 family protein [Raineyella sp. LH-20]